MSRPLVYRRASYLDHPQVGRKNLRRIKRLHDLAADEMLTYIKQKYR